MNPRTILLAAVVGIGMCACSSTPKSTTTVAGVSSTPKSTTTVAGVSGTTESPTAGNTTPAPKSGGTFRTGKATIVTASKTYELTLDSGSFIASLGAHGSVSVLWASGDTANILLVGDGNGGYKVSVGGDPAPNKITQNDCTATVTNDSAAGVQGTLTCSGGITGSFEAK